MTILVTVFACSISLLSSLHDSALAQNNKSAFQSPRNVIIFVCDGLRAGSVNPVDSPTLSALENAGVKFVDSHSLFPTFTTPNASAIATGHDLGDTGDFSNVLYPGFPETIEADDGVQHISESPSVENDQVLGDIDDHFGGNYLTEESLLALARAAGYSTAAVGKQGPVLVQDVTQGAPDPASGGVPIPGTVIIDDSTGRLGGIPLSPLIIQALADHNLPDIAPKRGANGQMGTNTTPGTLTPNTVQQQYFIDTVTKAILPTFQAKGHAFVLVYWSRDPDGSQHYQGDSLNSLTPGINGPTSKAAIKNVDNNLAQMLEYLKSNGLVANTDIFVVADHGFSTMSRHEVDSVGTPTRSYSSTFIYKDLKGRQDVNTGFAPVGFVAIDLAHELSLPLYDADSLITVNGQVQFEPVDPTIGEQTAVERQHPANGDGLIGGTGTVKSPTDAQVVVAANGGSDLIYLPTGSLQARRALARKIVAFLVQQDYTSGLFVGNQYGALPGSLPLSAINLLGNTGMPTPAIVVNFRSFTTNHADPVNNAVTFCDNVLQEGQGMHGSFSRADTYNFMAAYGPDFKRSFVDRSPVSNADVEVTLAHILRFHAIAHGKLIGRVLTETLYGAADSPGKVKRGFEFSKPAANGKVTQIDYQQLNTTRYFDAAGFAGETVGL